MGFLRNPDAYVEIISYAKLLSDAKRRNAIFFKQLGITNVDPENPASDDGNISATEEKTLEPT